MTANDIRDRIVVTEEDFGADICINATLQISVSTWLDKMAVDCSQDRRGLLDFEKKRTRENLIRQIYEDQRQELSAAIYELLCADPMTTEFQDAKNRLIKAATCQQPKEEQP